MYTWATLDTRLLSKRMQEALSVEFLMQRFSNQVISPVNRCPVLSSHLPEFCSSFLDPLPPLLLPSNYFYCFICLFQYTKQSPFQVPIHLLLSLLLSVHSGLFLKLFSTGCSLFLLDYCLLFLIRNHEDGCSTFFLNIRRHLVDYTASHPKG